MTTKGRTSFRPPLLGGFGCALLLLALASPAKAQKTPPKPDDGVSRKTHTLYMGADISIRRGEKLYRVKDVSGESFVIDVNGEPTYVSFRGAGVEMKIQESLKLDRSSASLTALKSERIYSPGTDPNRKFVDNSKMVLGATEALDAAASKLSGAGKSNWEGPSDKELANFESANAALGSDFNSVAYHVRALNEELAKELYDAIALSFEVSSEQPLLHPYVLVIARLHEKDGKPEEYKNWILAKQLVPLGERVEKVKITQGGLPPGYSIEKLQVHLYDRGKEIPTTVSAKRVSLTAEEAFQYLLIDYIASNKGATLPATPALAVLPADFTSRLEKGEFKPVYYVRVTKDGLPRGVFLDSNCTEKATDEYVTTLLAKVRFRPALEKGKAIDGVASVVLGKLP